ncbi:MAG TPA: outer membrane beta-barrel protein [Terracidiphilus sp.]|nr:outer membrane beta-barrel protein [Terracidiphilus sp.]
MYQRCFRVLFASLLLSAAIPLFSQVVPEAQEFGLPIRLGVGYSNYGSDWHGGTPARTHTDGNRLGGPAVWIDYDIPRLPPSWSGFQIEAEARDLGFNRTGNDPTLRQYTFAGGLNYAWRYDPVFHPYVKFLTGIGNVDFESVLPYYRKDSRIFYAPAGGIEVRAYQRLWIRGNYEYQFWPDFFGYHTLNPHGFTIGVFYDNTKYALAKMRY